MPNNDVLLTIIVFVPFVASALALLVGRRAGRATGVLMVLAALIAFAASLKLYMCDPLATPALQVKWIEGMNIFFSLRGDSFGLFFAMLVSGMGTLVGIYSLGYIPKLDSARVGRYYAALIAFMGAMLGVALSDDLILLFVFWEITSISSFMLIGFWYEKDDGRKGAMTALQVTALGGLAMMVGFVMVGVICGTFSISDLQQNQSLQQTLAASALFTPALLLILAGAFTKSAQWPFHFWLPNAMVAPTPVSTYLHAATMVKAGIFLVGRMLPVFGDNSLWLPLVAGAGLITFFLGAYQSFHETDLKAILARTTLSTLGLVMFIYGINIASQDALQIMNHAAYKGALFLIVGIVEHATHTRDIRELSGLRRKMPITFLLCVVAALSMSGLPPFFGFVAKESFYGSLLKHNINPWLIGVCVLGNAFIFAVSWKIILGVFCGEPSEKAGHAHEAGAALWFSPAVLVLIVIGMGLAAIGHFSQDLVRHLSSAAKADVHVSLIPSLDHPGPLLLSAATIGLGTLIYRLRDQVGAVQIAMRDAIPTMQSLWDKFIASITAVATGYSSRWQNGSLHWYFTGTLVFAVGLIVYTAWHFGLLLFVFCWCWRSLPWCDPALDWVRPSPLPPPAF
jgi:multicomponent Na+:H+ antiporter subunit A